MKASTKNNLTALAVIIGFPLSVVGLFELFQYLEARTGIHYAAEYAEWFIYALAFLVFIGILQYVIEKSYQLWQQYWNAD